MKKNFLFTLMLAFAVSSVVVAQSTRTWTMRPVFGIAGHTHRGLVLSGGIKLDSISAPPMSLMLSFGLPKTSFGLTYMIYPFRRKNAKPAWIGFGVDYNYFYKSNFNVYTELGFGGKGKNTIKNPKGEWHVTRIVFTPAVELFFNMGENNKWQMGSKINFIYGFWDHKDHSWSEWNRWYDLTVFLRKRF